MNPLIIILGVVVVFLVYQLYSIYTSVPTVASNIYLGSSTSEVDPISASSIASPNVSIYTIGFWIYINTFSNGINEFIAFGNTKDNTIKHINSDFLTGSYPNDENYMTTSLSNQPQNVCTFSINNDKPIIYANISTYKSNSQSEYYIESIPITTNLPIQTWTYVLVSVSTNAGNYADCYLNGKLLVSQQLKFIPYNIGSTASTTNKITNTFLFPNINTSNDITLTRISWIPYAIDPQTAWYYYNQGNGNPSGSGIMSSYHLDVNLTKDGEVYHWNIF